MWWITYRVKQRQAVNQEEKQLKNQLLGKRLKWYEITWALLKEFTIIAFFIIEINAKSSFDELQSFLW